MKINRNVTNLEHYLITDGLVFEGFQNIRYLGTLVTFKKCKISEEIKSRLLQAIGVSVV